MTGDELIANMQAALHISQEIEKLSWYHPSLDRHVAESLLLQNACDGTYLIRPSSKRGEYALSVRCNNSVKHFVIALKNNEVHFGYGVFKTITEFLCHFNNRPLISGESGQLILLKEAYPRSVQEPETYETVKVHAVFNVEDENDNKSKPDYAMNSKEGFLTKLGYYFKTWKTRWFVLQKNKLSYFREKSDTRPIKVLDLSEANECMADTTTHIDRNFVIKLVFAWRTFYMYASTDAEMKEWIKLIQWRIYCPISTSLSFCSKSVINPVPQLSLIDTPPYIILFKQ